MSDATLQDRYCDGCWQKGLNCDRKKPCANCTHLFLECLYSQNRDHPLAPRFMVQNMPMQAQPTISKLQVRTVQFDKQPGSRKEKGLRSCDQCRKSHLSCDSKTPCSRCVLQSRECVRSESVRVNKKKKTTTDGRQYIGQNTFEFDINSIIPQPILQPETPQKQETSVAQPEPLSPQQAIQEVQRDNLRGSRKISAFRSCERCQRSHLGCDIQIPCSRCIKRAVECKRSGALPIIRMKKNADLQQTGPNTYKFDINPVFPTPETQPALTQIKQDSKGLAISPKLNQRIEAVASQDIQIPFYMPAEVQSPQLPFDAEIEPFIKGTLSQENVACNQAIQTKPPVSPDLVSNLRVSYGETDLFGEAVTAQTDSEREEVLSIKKPVQTSTDAQSVHSRHALNAPDNESEITSV